MKSWVRSSLQFVFPNTSSDANDEWGLNLQILFKSWFLRDVYEFI
jgi:hypothetical protein